MNLIKKLALLGVLALASAAPAAEWGNLSAMHQYAECFGLDAARKTYPYKLTILESNAPGNVFHEADAPTFTFQVENLTAEPLKATGRIDIVRYSQSGQDGDQWWPELRKLEDAGSLPIAIDLPAKGWKNITISPKTPATRGGYALVVDLGPLGRQYLTSYVRTFKPDEKRIQYPKQALEEMPPEILDRLGIRAIRWGVSYIPSTSKRYEEHLAKIDEEMKAMHAGKVTILAEVGASGEGQPMGRARPHLDDKGFMKDGKTDMAWLPEHDEDYQKFVYLLATKYGWPNGPITAFDLWNEPWEGLSISGWAADIPRYRELYKRMGDAIFAARKDAKVDVLVGGCDSSTNTWDKLFGDGSNEFMPYLDFCSIHYQGLGAPVLHPEWNNRTHHKGRVLVWDTESWVANTDDRYAGVVATNRAAGYDRSMGSLSRIAVSTLSHGRIQTDLIKTPEGEKKVPRLIESRPMAAAYGAVQHFIGERNFKEILFQNGLPWVYVFDGLEGKADDGTVVVVGDIDSLFGSKRQRARTLFAGVRSLDEIATRAQLRDQLAKLPKDAPAAERSAIEEQFIDPMPLSTCSVRIDASSGLFSLYDFYGNPVPSTDGKIVIPLSDRAFFLRADPAKPGSFAALVNAVRNSRITGLEPLDIVAHDMTRPIDQKPTLRLRLTNQHNQPISGTLAVTLGQLKLDYPASLSFAPREQKWVQVNVVGGAASPANTYPLAVAFNAGDLGTAVHDEPMHVNFISRRTITVDGKLDDWAGVIPQTVNAAGSGASFEEAMWLPFQKVDANSAAGVATAYVAYDAAGFHFAAKIADDTPSPGRMRFEKRDEDADFYPAVSYERVTPNPTRGRNAAPADPEPVVKEHKWPDGVRRFSYRQWPDIPSTMGQKPADNVLIAFNAIPLGEDGWLSHLPGRMPKFVGYKTTDYQYALNKVADTYGGGTEIWRLESPGMVRKHFYPRQSKHPLEGPVKAGQLGITHEEGVRIVECSIPWAEIPHVKKLLDEGKPVKFSFRVNHDRGGPTLELARGRSAAEGTSKSFHPDWSASWPNELEFGWEK